MRKTIREHYSDGRKAGFPLCCILFFFIHIVLFRLSKRYQYYRYLESCNGKRGTNHINCPWHERLHRKKKYMPNWGHCRECHEGMIISESISSCRFCGSSDLVGIVKSRNHICKMRKTKCVYDN